MVITGLSRLIEPPRTCEDGHDWIFTGYDADDRPTYKCRRCGEECEG